MLNVELSDLARADLTEIFVYTRKTWSERQAVHYLDALDACWRTLAENPGLGRDRADLRPNLMSYPTERHISFFEIDGDTLTIIRILHTSQDPDAAFPPPTP
jgi:toxin ParE1/3/4